MLFANLLSIVLMMAAFVPAPLASAQEASAKVDELIVKSGLQRQIGLMPEVVNASFEQRMSQDAKVKPEEAAQLREAIAQSVTPAVILGSIKEHIQGNLAESDLDAILVWLNSSLGQKITKMEEEASSAQAYLELQTFAQGLANNPPDPARVEVLGQLDQAAHMSQFSVNFKMDMMINMTEAMAIAAGRTDVRREDLLMALESNRVGIEQGSAQEVLISGLYGYQGLTVEELKEYVNFYKSEAGQKYADVVTRGLSDALNKTFKDMGRRFGEVIKKENAKDVAKSQ